VEKGAAMDGDAEDRSDNPSPLSNAEIADRLASLAQLLSTQKENPYKVKAYRRAAERIRTFSESLDEMVREDADLTRFPGIGSAIASAIREIVTTRTLGKLERLRREASDAVSGISAYPRLDPKQVLRIYKKLNISSVEELRRSLESGDIEKALGLRTAQHVRQGLTDAQAILLYKADDLREAVEEFLVGICRARRAEAAGDYRRRAEIIEELVFVIETDDFPAVVARMRRYGGRTPLVYSREHQALFALSAGIHLRLQQATEEDWGLHMLACTGSQKHVRKLEEVAGPLRSAKGKSLATEKALYRALGLAYSEPELRESHGEIELAMAGALPALVSEQDFKGDLHAHTTSSDGSDSIEAMASAAEQRGYEYLGISDHSQSLKIARGVCVTDLWAQIRHIDNLNAKASGFRIL
jgi:DNA polymerase (family 10)